MHPLKVLESIVHQIVTHFLQPLISTHQHGFLQGKSCLTQLLHFYPEIFKLLDNGFPTDVVFVDFRKTFDTVLHSELLFKPCSLGTTGPLWHWFKAYLSHHLHYVHIDHISSSCLPLFSRFPQGGVLGPLLFLVYIYDIPNVINFSSTYLYADDTKFVWSVHIFHDSSLLQDDINSLLHWRSAWNLSLNSKKCSFVHLRAPQSPDWKTWLKLSN